MNHKLPFSRSQFTNIIDEISHLCESWLCQWHASSPHGVRQRIEYMHGFKCLVQTLIGLVISPRLGNTKDVYIFEGLRNKKYMQAFDSSSVVIIGSHLEKKYADAHGYGFCWSFPIVSSIQTNISRRWNFPAIRQLVRWTIKLSRFQRVIFFLYEDTQPLGLFFVHVGRLFANKKITSVCIQHGYYAKTSYPIRNEGGLSDVNFVWDLNQIDLIGANKEKTYEIGLPYIASAKQSNVLNIILVGNGMVGDGTDFFHRSLSAYLHVCNLRDHLPNISFFYRPHPIELANEKTLCYLRSKFTLIDQKDKVELLNGQKSIFIGSISTLLYEAGIAGHLIVHLNLGDGIPAFKFDFEFNENEAGKLLEWVLSIRDNINVPNKSLNIPHVTPLDRFNYALRNAGLVD
jgi:hypothetical protein